MANPTASSPHAHTCLGLTAGAAFDAIFDTDRVLALKWQTYAKEQLGEAGSHFVYSVTSTVPAPPPADEYPILRVDGRFGPHDPLCAPQWLTRGSWHQAFFPMWRASHHNLDDDMIFFLAEEDDIEWPSAQRTSRAFTRTSLVDLLQHKLKHREVQFKRDTRRQVEELGSMMTGLPHDVISRAHCALRHLRQRPVNLWELRHSMTGVQRALAELKAHHAFLYQLRATLFYLRQPDVLTAEETEAVTTRKVLPFRGLFTTDFKVAGLLRKLRAPVYLCELEDAFTLAKVGPKWVTITPASCVLTIVDGGSFNHFLGPTLEDAEHTLPSQQYDDAPLQNDDHFQVPPDDDNAMYVDAMYVDASGSNNLPDSRDDAEVPPDDDDAMQVDASGSNNVPDSRDEAARGIASHSEQ
jgi:hypothetical protein